MSRLALGCALSALIAQPVLAAERWPYSTALKGAFALGEFKAALTLLREDLARCDASQPVADECLDLLLALINVEVRTGDARAGEAYGQRALEIAPVRAATRSSSA